MPEKNQPSRLNKPAFSPKQSQNTGKDWGAGSYAPADAHSQEIPVNNAEQGLVRLNKALADAGICSRRKADEKIFAGLVRVNGQIVLSPGIQVNPARDTIECEGKALIAPAGEAPCWLMLHKPTGVVATAQDPQGRPTVLAHVPPAFQHLRLYPVGRLDFFSEGLLLLTNDGPLAHRLTHPKWHIPREYRVIVRLTKGFSRKNLDQALETMRHGMTLAEGEILAPVEVSVLEENAPSTSGLVFSLSMVLHQGINRQIRRMCRDTGLTVLKLTRISQGPLQLGDLPSGQCRPLSPAELTALQKAVGL